MTLEELYLTIENEFKAVNKLILHFESIIENEENHILNKFPELEKLKEDKLHPPNEVVLKREMYPDEALDYFQSTHHYFQISFTYPKILWPSLFISLFSFFEHVLHRLCIMTVQAEVNYDRNKYRHLEKYKRFLKDKGVDFPDQNHAWIKINFYKELRDVIVHNRSHIETFNFKKKNTRQKIDEHPFLSVKNGYLILTPLFLRETMQIFETFISLLFKAIQKMHNKAAQTDTPQ